MFGKYLVIIKSSTNKFVYPTILENELYRQWSLYYGDTKLCSLTFEKVTEGGKLTGDSNQMIGDGPWTSLPCPLPSGRVEDGSSLSCRGRPTTDIRFSVTVLESRYLLLPLFPLSASFYQPLTSRTKRS